jgi:hypothetical protein
LPIIDSRHAVKKLKNLNEKLRDQLRVINETLEKTINDVSTRYVPSPTKEQKYELGHILSSRDKELENAKTLLEQYKKDNLNYHTKLNNILKAPKYCF